MGIILETKEPEKAWNALGFAVTGKKKRHEVKVFLMGEGVEVESLHHEQYPAGAVMKEFHALGGEAGLWHLHQRQRHGGYEGLPHKPHGRLFRDGFVGRSNGDFLRKGEVEDES